MTTQTAIDRYNAKMNPINDLPSPAMRAYKLAAGNNVDHGCKLQNHALTVCQQWNSYSRMCAVNLLVVVYDLNANDEAFLSQFI